MRLLIDSLVALMLAGVLAGVVMASRESESIERNVQVAAEGVWRIQEELTIQTALRRDGTQMAHPSGVEPEWFRGELPQNPLLEDDRPWLEIASPRERMLLHPIDKAAIDRRAARFWYNPANGVIRARVPLLVSDADTIDVYNRVNGTTLTQLYGQEQ